ncbi:insulin-like growth factor-binding protein complex acid labile subunit [Asterias rubens]|uniref:insulin-like growth factor-binding protein complex acid labile subunit n=1 Tax=Asterias rubens TaxID=7604 RepID=UPI001455A2FA|nr:insulin-like growth factor-binding protein complex acid labile subunit [Asterias rubens]
MAKSIPTRLLGHCLVLLAITRVTINGFEFYCLDSISQCDCDQTKLHVDCSNMGFNDVPLTDMPNDTSSFSFGGNNLAVLFQDTFVKFKSLLSLSLDKNIIGFIESGSLVGPSNLKRLDLSGNRLSTFPLALRVLTSLEVLNLSGNALAYLSADDFQYFPQLETLRLENNAIYSIPGTIFEPLPNLSLLYLSGNLLSTDPIGWFKTCTVLTHLSLSYNSLPLTSSVEDWFEVSSNIPLEELQLVGNDMEAVQEETFRSCVNLKELHLDFNHIETIENGSFKDLVQLQNLTLGSNHLTELPDGLFQTTEGVLTLTLKGNALSELPSVLFDGLSQMTELNLAGNRLVNVFTTSCVEARNTVVSCVSSSPYLPALTSLYLEGNSLASVPDVANFNNLVSLDLSNNVLTHIVEYAFNGTSMKLIHLHDNLLSTISLENFQHLPDLEQVTISGNEWDCNCSLHWLVDPEADKIVWKEALFNDIICSTPNIAKYLDLPTLYLYRESFRDNGPFASCKVVDWVTIVVIIATWFVVGGLALICYLRHTVSYRKGYHTRTVRKKVKLPEKPASSPLPTAAFLNAGSTIDELDRSTATDITYVASPSRTESRINEKSKDKPTITPIEVDTREVPGSKTIKPPKWSVADTPV